ncbi:MAG: ATP-binding protein [Sphingobacteriales bacterium]|nr:ATP-binding protein [Sphingobacteriales bacterium]
MIGQTAPKQNRRYLGVYPYKAEDKRLFFGRNREIDEMVNLLKAKELVVLFAKSGIGKSSLLNAGVIPSLENQGWQSLPVRFNNFEINPVQAVSNALVNFLDIAKLKRFAKQNPENGQYTLWENLRACTFSGNQGQSLKPILIFDQFEEFFNHPKPHRDHFAQQIAEIISLQIPPATELQLLEIPRRERTAEILAWYSPIDIHVLFVIRSDRLHLLDDLTTQVTAILKTRYNLRALSPPDAEQALQNPACLQGDNFYTEPFTFAPNALQLILKTLANNEQEVEAFQLQILGQVIEDRVKNLQLAGKQNVVVDVDLLGGEEGINNILSNYYEDQIAQITNPDEKNMAQNLMEENLIMQGKRVSQPEAMVKDLLKNNDPLLGLLLNSRLIRAENSRLGKTYEISHDTLVGPILNSFQRRELITEREKFAVETAKKNEQLARVNRIQRLNFFVSLFWFLLFLAATVTLFWAWQQKKRADLAEQKLQLRYDHTAEKVGEQSILYKKNDSLNKINDSLAQIIAKIDSQAAINNYPPPYRNPRDHIVNTTPYVTELPQKEPGIWGIVISVDKTPQLSIYEAGLMRINMEQLNTLVIKEKDKYYTILPFMDETSAKNTLPQFSRSLKSASGKDELPSYYAKFSGWIKYFANPDTVKLPELQIDSDILQQFPKIEKKK